MSGKFMLDLLVCIIRALSSYLVLPARIWYSQHLRLLLSKYLHNFHRECSQQLVSQLLLSLTVGSGEPPLDWQNKSNLSCVMIFIHQMCVTHTYTRTRACARAHTHTVTNYWLILNSKTRANSSFCPSDSVRSELFSLLWYYHSLALAIDSKSGLNIRVVCNFKNALKCVEKGDICCCFTRTNQLKLCFMLV